jgi:hypothetical protein
LDRKEQYSLDRKGQNCLDRTSGIRQPERTVGKYRQDRNESAGQPEYISKDRITVKI